MEKIIVFTPSLNIGGIERILLTYAKGFAIKGYDVTYLTLANQGDFDFEASENLRFDSLGVIRLRNALFPLIKYLKKNKPSIILCANEATAMIYFAKILSGISTKIITSHHNYYQNYIDLNFKSTFVPKYIYPRCFKVIAVSDGIKSMLSNDFNLDNNKIVTISNPLDISNVIKQANQTVNNLPDKYILFVGRFDKVKNIKLLIDSFNLFLGKFPDVKLLLIGGGTEEKNISEYISKLNLNSTINLLGVKSNPFPYIKNANLVVLSSLSEAYPTVLLESLVLGTTVVSTPTPGACDILEQGNYGYLSGSIDDVEDFYLKLVEGYSKPFEKDFLTKYAHSNFSLDVKVKEIEKIWKNL